ncbi:MAG: PEP-CTERM sorting domain-containing protein [Isosphaeraceae bacterium]
MIVMRLTRTALVLTVLFAVAPAAHAQAVLGVSSATTNMGQILALSAIYDQSGLSTGYTSGVTGFDSYIASNPTHDSLTGSNIWASNLITTGNVDLNLGGTFTIDRFALWNKGGNAPLALRGFNLLASPDSSFTTTTNLGSFTATNSGTDTATVAQVFSFAATSAAYVRIQITSNFGGTLTEMGEVAFRQASAVPEPSTWLLAGVAVGFGGLAHRRRTRRHAA